MSQEYQIPRNSLAWLLVAQAAVILPHVGRLPMWVLGVCVACGTWRILIYQGRIGYPGRWTKTAFVIAGIAGVPIVYRTLLGLEPAVALLFVAFVLKLLEMQRKRDAYVVIFLAYFATITEFLFDQTIPVAIYMTGVLLTITAAMVGLNQTLTYQKPLVTLRKASIMFVQALPLMLVLFVLFPRLDPLWTVPLQRNVGKTGVSDSMTPGDIAELTQSDALAFRATFEGKPPAAHQLYWRGLVLSEFRGRSWTQWGDGIYGRRDIYFPDESAAGWDDNIERIGNEFKYTVILEPTQQNWIFALPSMVSETAGIGLVRDHRLYSVKPVQSKTRYQVTSYLDYANERSITPWYRSRLTKLPQTGNPRTKTLARELLDQSDSVEQFVARVLYRFNQQEFIYTLKPDILGDDAMDEFLFETRRGFCEHYAGSFVYMMRAAGVPARVVVGYQGGEFNPNGNYIAVHQFDAHAWAEVWLEGEGWRRVDPTSAVAPERIEEGLEAALEEEDTFLSDSPFSWMKYRQILFLTDLRLQLSAIGHYWDTWVLGYNPTTQMKLLGRFFEDISITKLGVILLASFFGVLAIIGLFLLGRRAKSTLSVIDREYQRFCGLLQRQGLARLTGEPPLGYAERISQARPDLSEAVGEVTRLYVDLNYAGSGEVSEADLRRAVRALRVKMLSANI